MRHSVLALACAVLPLSLQPSPGQAAAFFGWQVVGVPAGDLLNVRTGPSATAGMLVGYPNGTRLSLTGRCTRNLHLDAISGEPAARQRRLVRGRWCEVWLDPTGSGQFRAGWVNARFIRPL